MVTRILADMDTAMAMFGTYQFQDKGAREVMDLDPILEDLKAMHPEDAADVLCELLTHQESPNPWAYLLPQLVSDLLVDLQDVDDGWWDILISREELAELF
jgi:hypothetical protein